MPPTVDGLVAAIAELVAEMPSVRTEAEAAAGAVRDAADDRDEIASA